MSDKNPKSKWGHFHTTIISLLKKRRNPSFELYLVEMEQFPLQLQEQNEREETQR